MEFQFTHPGRGATTYQKFRTLRHHLFQFTHPGRGATDPTSTTGKDKDVSIHAPREGCDDRLIDNIRSAAECFNSRTPGGVRHPRNGHTKNEQGVSIHAPREGCDFPY